MSEVERTELVPGFGISRIIKGGWHLAGGHGPVDSEKAVAEMDDYVAAGITAFDCADIYTGVEDLIGAYRRDRKARGRDDVLATLKVHTKCVPDLDKLTTITKDQVQATIDRSLRRLGSERLDLVQFHWWDLAVERYVEVASWLSDFQREGKIDQLATTNFNTSCMRELVASGYRPASIQLQYSLLDRRAQREMIGFCAENDIKLLCYGTVAGGFLADKWLGQTMPVESLENRSLTKYRLIIEDAGGWEAFQALLTLLRDIADKHGTDVASVAMKAMLQDPAVTAIIVGVRHGGHLDKHAKLFDVVLDADDMARIDAMVSQMPVVDGDVYDVERDRNGRHGRIMKYNLNEA